MDRRPEISGHVVRWPPRRAIRVGGDIVHVHAADVCAAVGSPATLELVLANVPYGGAFLIDAVEIATAQGDTACVQLILDAAGDYPLFLEFAMERAVRDGHVECLEALLNHYAPPVSPQLIDTAIRRAAEYTALMCFRCKYIGTTAFHACVDLLLRHNVSRVAKTEV
jgi:hypothetical protein